MLNYLLAVLLLSRFGQVFALLLIHSNQLQLFPFVHQMFMPLFYAAPACFFLYVIGFINNRTKLRKFDYLHFIPFIVAIIHVLPWPFASSSGNWNIIAKQILENKQMFILEKNGLFPPYFYYIGRPVLLMGYLSASWYVLLKARNSLVERIGETGKKWIFIFLNTATFFQVFSLFPLIKHGINDPSVNSSFVILNCLVLLAIVIFIFHNPKIFYGYLFVAVEWGRNNDVVKDIVQPITLSKKVSLLPEQLSHYEKAMKAYMESGKPYLLKEFQIIDLARQLNISVHHCSFVINNEIGKNFRDWINAYRIGHFMAQYPLMAHKMTIEAIAYESGFKSLATFYNAFKKETGLMPTAYFSKQKEP